MTYRAVIDMAKGETKRIHLAFDGSGFVDLGPIKAEIPINDGVMPVHYGYLDGVINKADSDHVDVLIFSNKTYQTGDEVDVEIIGLLTRADGDHKVLAIDGSRPLTSFTELPAAEQDLVLKYFGYKAKIVSVDDKAVALQYLQMC